MTCTQGQGQWKVRRRGASGAELLRRASLPACHCRCRLAACPRQRLPRSPDVRLPRWLTFRQELLQTPKGRARLLAGRPHVEGVEWIDRQTAAVEGHKRGKAQHRHRRHGRQRADEAAAGKGRSDASGGGGAPKQGTPDVNPAARSPFDEAAAGAPASAPPSPPATATEPAVSGEERAGGAGGCGGAGGAEEFEDASEARLHGEQSLGGTVWFSPATSLAPTASTEGTQPDAAAAAAVEPAAAVAGNEAVPPAAPAAQAEERRGAKGSEGGGSGGSVGGASESGYSAGSSEGSEEVEVGRCGAAELVRVGRACRAGHAGGEERSAGQANHQLGSVKVAHGLQGTEHTSVSAVAPVPARLQNALLSPTCPPLSHLPAGALGQDCAVAGVLPAARGHAHARQPPAARRPGGTSYRPVGWVGGWVTCLGVHVVPASSVASLVAGGEGNRDQSRGCACLSGCVVRLRYGLVTMGGKSGFALEPTLRRLASTAGTAPGSKLPGRPSSLPLLLQVAGPSP